MIYADFNATTPLGRGAKDGMAQALEAWGNPSSGHKLGRKALELINKARESLAETLSVSPSEIVFTSGGSEANTLALLGSALDGAPGFRLLTSGVEHSSIIDTVSLIEKLGGHSERVLLDGDGNVCLENFERQLEQFQPHLVSLMTANNETGVLFPMPEIAALCAKHKVRLHTDAVQAFGKIPANFYNDAPLISVSAHKIYGPKGAGALIVRSGIKLVATHYGGAQEVKRRGGTENVLGIAGFGGACDELKERTQLDSLKNLRDTFEKRIRENLDGVSLQGNCGSRIPNTSNLRFHGIPSEVLLSALDIEGICVSAGSACSSGSISASHVLLAMGLKETEAKECLRFSWGRTTTDKEIEDVAQSTIAHVNRIRERRK